MAANFSFGNITSPKRVEAFHKELISRDIAVYDIPIPRNVTDFPNIVRSYLMLRKLCYEKNYCLLHTQSPIGGVVSRLAAKKSRKKGMKVVYTAHGFHFFKGAAIFHWLFFYPVEKWLSAYTDTLITMNGEDYRRAKFFYAGQVCRLPGIGLHLEKYSADKKKRMQMRRKFGFKEHEFVILSVGQLSRRKNQKTMIHAMALLKETDARYVIAGLGECEKEYRKLISRLQLRQYVRLLGYWDDIPSLLQMADCFAFPSLQEGLPVSLMEAMAAGVPIICSRIRGNRDLIRDKIDGIMLDPYDAAGYAHAIRQFMNNHKLADDYRTQAGIRIREFSAKRVNSTMEKIYRQYLKSEQEENLL
ncbi:MAG: glycosyltransferase family 4 protein [Eubacterium sp.]|nr:glycosyltransferase family 4 protein [Eubacterium sp.]